jgi:TPR repeat protein
MEQGHVGAWESIARAYERKKEEIGIKCWREGAKQGNAEARFALGKAYYYGRGVRKNRKKALKLLQLAAQNLDEAGRFLQENNLEPSGPMSE